MVLLGHCHRRKTSSSLSTKKKTRKVSKWMLSRPHLTTTRAFSRQLDRKLNTMTRHFYTIWYARYCILRGRRNIPSELLQSDGSFVQSCRLLLTLPGYLLRPCYDVTKPGRHARTRLLYDTHDNYSHSSPLPEWFKT